MILNVSTDPTPAIRPASGRQYDDREIEGPAREGGGGYDSKESIADVNFVAGLLVGSFITGFFAVLWAIVR